MNLRALKTAPLIFLVLLGHIAMPLLFVVQLFTIPRHNLPAWLLSFFVAGGYILLIFLTGAWSWFGRVMRYGLPTILLAAAAVTYPVESGRMAAPVLSGAESIIPIAIGMVFLIMTMPALRSRKIKGETLDLDFPLRCGTFVVAQGGTMGILNLHAASPSQRFAIDILKLNALGVRASGLYPADPERYAIFGAEVVSPCAGIVAAAEDGHCDFRPPERDREHRAGNFIAIECRGATIYLAHLLNGSITVHPGDYVAKGRMLGRVGNSGNTTEPHLHIHAEEGAYPGKFSGNAGVPMRFNGRFLVRNDRVNVE